MEHLLNNHVKDIEISGIRKFFNLVADEKDVVSLTIGQPDFHTPENVKKAAAEAIHNNKTTYTANAGILPLREAITDFYETHYAASYKPESEVIVTAGASQAIDITFRTILSPGDEVLLPAPIYPGYEPLIKLAGAIPVYMDTRKTDFKVTAQLLEEHINEKTKCVVLPYPSNPTGASLSATELETLADVVAGRELFILADEIYSQLVFDRPHTSIASFPAVKDQTIVINGVSKSHSMTGFRIGYTLAPAWLAKHMLKVHQYNVSCATSISQYAALEALTGDSTSTETMRNAYRERRNYVYERLQGMGLDVNMPEGAFYFFPKFPDNGLTSFEIGLQLVREAKVALVPGDSFSKLGNGYMRLSYAYDMDTLKEGLDRLESFLKK